jgi:hypothetical protein
MTEQAGKCGCAAHDEAVRASARMAREISQLRKRLSAAEHRERTARMGLTQKVADVQQQRDAYIQMLSERASASPSGAIRKEHQSVGVQTPSPRSPFPTAQTMSSSQLSTELKLRALGPASLDTTPVLPKSHR